MKFRDMFRRKKQEKPKTDATLAGKPVMAEEPVGTIKTPIEATENINTLLNKAILNLRSDYVVENFGIIPPSPSRKCVQAAALFIMRTATPQNEWTKELESKWRAMIHAVIVFRSLAIQPTLKPNIMELLEPFISKLIPCITDIIALYLICLEGTQKLRELVESTHHITSALVFSACEDRKKLLITNGVSHCFAQVTESILAPDDHFVPNLVFRPVEGGKRFFVSQKGMKAYFLEGEIMGNMLTGAMQIFLIQRLEELGQDREK